MNRHIIIIICLLGHNSLQPIQYFWHIIKGFGLVWDVCRPPARIYGRPTSEAGFPLVPTQNLSHLGGKTTPYLIGPTPRAVMGIPPPPLQGRTTTSISKHIPLSSDNKLISFYLTKKYLHEIKYVSCWNLFWTKCHSLCFRNFKSIPTQTFTNHITNVNVNL